jgi:DNA-binding PadR family transcriptional regulator
VTPTKRCEVAILTALVNGHKTRAELWSASGCPKGTVSRGLGNLEMHGLIAAHRHTHKPWEYVITAKGLEQAQRPGPETKIPGRAARIEVISSECRRFSGDCLVVDEALARIRSALTEALKGWPADKGASFWLAVTVTVDREGRTP